MPLSPARLATIAAAADAGDAVKLKSSEVKELLRGYKKGQKLPRAVRREPLIVDDLAQLEVVVTVPKDQVGRYTHKGLGRVWAYDVAAVAEAVGVSEAKVRRVVRGEVEGLQLRPSNLADVLALYDAVRGAKTGAL